VCRVFILGSCVSRDALESASGKFEITHYIARTSIASIGMEAVSDDDVRRRIEALQSPFQRRMVLNDLDKTTMSLIAGTPFDLLLLDFVDERFNLVLSGSTFFSMSGELERSGLDISGRSVVTPESDVFLVLWLAGLQRPMSSIERSKIVLNRVYWAEHFPDGKDVASMGWIRRSNAQLQRLYDAVDKYWLLPRIDYPPEVVLADRESRWGIAPYHYTEILYQHTLAELEKIAGAI